MSLLALFANIYENSPRFIDNASMLLARALVSQPLTPHIVSTYLRKAFRSGAWKTLSPEERALLIFISRYWRREIRSKTLVEILKRIAMKIELSTLRGRALLYGLAEYVRRGLGTIADALRNIGTLLWLGISYLNNPPMYRIYG